MFIEKLSDEHTFEFFLKYPAYTFWFEGSSELKIVGYYLIDRDIGLEINNKKILLLMHHIKDNIVYVGDGVSNYLSDMGWSTFENLKSGHCHIAFDECARAFRIYNS